MFDLYMSPNKTASFPGIFQWKRWRAKAIGPKTNGLSFSSGSWIFLMSRSWANGFAALSTVNLPTEPCKWARVEMPRVEVCKEFEMESEPWPWSEVRWQFRGLTRMSFPLKLLEWHKWREILNMLPYALMYHCVLNRCQNPKAMWKTVTLDVDDVWEKDQKIWQCCCGYHSRRESIWKRFSWMRHQMLQKKESLSRLKYGKNIKEPTNFGLCSTPNNVVECTLRVNLVSRCLCLENCGHIWQKVMIWKSTSDWKVSQKLLCSLWNKFLPQNKKSSAGTYFISLIKRMLMTGSCSLMGVMSWPDSFTRALVRCCDYVERKWIMHQGTPFHNSPI